MNKELTVSSTVWGLLSSGAGVIERAGTDASAIRAHQKVVAVTRRTRRCPYLATSGARVVQS
ncbi:MAG: hypothetical protein HZB26_10670 [Candidatus Hydrogenedentes bacterium]|nr:hypothetical protein [Candidatus Hydrogenedentota bacterium]